MQLPLFLKGTVLRCLVIGGGTVAERKVRILIDREVSLSLVALEIGDSLQSSLQSHGVPFEIRSFKESDLNDVDLVICATDDQDLNGKVSQLCQEKHILVNVVDNFALSTVTFPAIVERNPIQIAISTEGYAPTLARRLRTRIENTFSPRIGRLAHFLQEKRSSISDLAQRRKMFDLVIDSDIPNLLERNRLDDAEKRWEQLNEDQSKQLSMGFVSIVGAGPGDADLLTLKAVRAMERADVVFYDNLVSTEVIDRIRRDADRIYVGKKRSYADTRQGEINRLLVEAAQQGLQVVRLKGGDPFLFGRGGEEVEALVAHGVNFEVVPGVTAAQGCAAYAGIPLTHRDHAQSVRFVTGHLRSDQINLNWPELAKADQTLVVYMGLANLHHFTENLMENGMAGTTPIALISRGTLTDQKIIRSDLESVSRVLSKEELKTPTTAIIGSVAGINLQR